MFQTFENTSHPEHGPARLVALRTRMASEGLNGFLIPRADRFQGEYVADRDARLSWLTGFTGSAGFCAALTEKAGVFIDGRYRTQVKSQVDLAHYCPVPWPETSLAEWLAENVHSGGRVGFDIWLHTVEQITDLSRDLLSSNVQIWPVESNLVDDIWDDQPSAPTAPAIEHPLGFSGESSESKRRRLAVDLKKSDVDHLIITQPDSLCWLLNVRGADIARNPVVHGMCILHADVTVDVFANPEKFASLVDYLGDEVRIHPESSLVESLASLEGRAQIDPSTAPFAIETILTRHGRPTHAPDPCTLAKACKNPVEIAGAQAAHLRDGIAMAEFLAWIDAETHKGTLTEIDVATNLESIRAKSNALREISFETIAGAGPNGAIMHYRVSNETNRPIKQGELLLVDSGGQYQDGTTDITRTMAIGDVGGEEKQCYTRVLKGLIAIDSVQFPKGMAGRDLDPLARIALWSAGQDFNHGTGHGVGSYLSVHEGPQRLSKAGTVPLQEGMILSNEPGYYREGAFGIRLENLIVVEPAPSQKAGDPERDFLRFRNLTFTPFDRRLIVAEMLTQAERAWVNRYHYDTFHHLKDHVSPETLAWLEEACLPLPTSSTPPKITVSPSENDYVIRAGGAVLGESSNALILTEGSLAPVVYFPRKDVAMAMLDASDHTTVCPHKGTATYFSIQTKSTVIENAVWTYETPNPNVKMIAGYLAFSGENVAVEQL